MKKIIKKVVENYARKSTNSCAIWLLHETKAPTCLIEK